MEKQNGNETLHELKVLVNYLLNHNASHVEELKDLNNSLKGQNQSAAYEIILKAIEDFKAGNDKLKQALDSINE